MTWTTTLAILHVALATITTSHVALTKRDSRSATLWVGIAWLSPIIGTTLYALFGINRIRRKARKAWTTVAERIKEQQRVCAQQKPDLGHLPVQLQDLAQLIGKVVHQPLQPGNRIELLCNGDQAYPAMCEAIQAARVSVTLATYLFQQDVVGERFVQALAQAVENGAEVRVLVDDAGSRYSFPRIFQSLKAAGIPCAAFHRRNRLVPKSTLNIRNHRKICVVDGVTAFTGGMNIQRAHVMAEQTKKPVQDVHFLVAGPVVRQLQEAFADDWLFATGETLKGDLWFPELPAAGDTIARCIPEGPDSDLDQLRWTILAAIGAARTSIQIVTPYFLPDPTIVAAINLACMRGVAVDIILPKYPNVPLVRWAVLGTLGQVLQHGGRAWFTPLPFDHSKLMLVDGEWTMIGSANWDVRSLRLNFELNLECYDRHFGQLIAQVIEAKRAQAEPISAKNLRERPLPHRLRDGLARLFAPML